MQTPKMPDHEAERVASLHCLNVLDTPSEERFDRITRLARRLFNTKIALVSLVDSNRQWFKSSIGLNATETPRDISFCGHTILGDEPFIINDALADDRFHDNPLVTGEPNIRFYAGCPLTGPNGYKIGTLCVIDDEPKALSHNDLQDLIDLASMVERELSALAMATIDELTMIHNRRGFEYSARKSLDFCHRQAMPATLAYIDLNHFKTINDTYGHQAGDRALVTFAQMLQQQLREMDVYARMGGDEFAILLNDTDESTAHHILTRFRQSVENFNQSNNLPFPLKFSLGLATSKQEEKVSLEHLLHQADTKMYQQKRNVECVA
ncbi:sensor domain-containing diguanylate cyclase [Flocculibacter collagenilyticus]|uniref:sensor domain-containing diguanylate cyclase n=1 Tax=Flocculibacter collagenilyticus TaxID=2744479 RepID=UPI0018F6AD7F|nr:sensor domain-containing diguanylate cyclase [Flocculibacter collagenilyticus]